MAIFHRPLARNLQAALRDLREPDERVRRSAIVDLARHAGEHATPEVVTALRKALQDADPVVRTEAAYSLGDARVAEALPALIVAIDDEDQRVRQAAIDAIGNIGDERATGRLVRALHDDRPDVRFQAIIALARVSPADARSAVLTTARDQDAHVRYIAVRIAEELYATDADLPSPVALDHDVAATAHAWLGDDDAGVRVAAAILLARTGNREAARCLVEVVEGRRAGVASEDEAAAVELVGEIGLDEAIPALERRAFGFGRWTKGYCSWLALVSLARLGHARARAEILRDLRAWSRHRRTMAVAAAGRARLLEAETIIERMVADESRVDQETVSEALEQIRTQKDTSAREKPR